MNDPLLIILSVLVTVGGVVGCVYSVRMLREAYRDVAQARRLAPERPELVVLGGGHIRSERNRLMTQVAFLVVGIASLFSNFVDIGTVGRGLTRIALFIGISLIFANSVLNTRTRRAVLEQLERDNGTDRGDQRKGPELVAQEGTDA